MTTRGARTTATGLKQVPCGDDNKRGNDNGNGTGGRLGRGVVARAGGNAARWVWSIVLLALVSGAAWGQSFDFQTGREPVAAVDGMWRFHVGDDPGWADPAMDDAGWALLRGDRSWAEQGYKGLGGFAWYRFAVKDVPARGVSLLLPTLMTDYEVFANGVRVGGEGEMPARVGTRGSVQFSRTRAYALPDGPADGRTVRVAIRVWHDPSLAPYLAGGVQGSGAAVGDAGLLATQVRLRASARLTSLAPYFSMGVLFGVLGLTVLGLFLWRPREREYLWFAVLMLVQSADAAVTVGMNSGAMRITTKDILEGFIGATVLSAALLFFSTVLGVRRSRWWWAAFWISWIGPVIPLVYLLGLPVGISTGVEVLVATPAALWVLGVLVREAWRGSANARLLVGPALLSYGTQLVTGAMWACAQMGFAVRGQNFLNVPVIEWPYPVSLAPLTDLVFVLALLVFLIRRFALSRAHEERFGAELEAAREVQRLLLPAKPPVTPGFLVETAYLPAQEVGGDFWQIAPGADGSLLLVVGDVSGKGLQAAMSVSTIVGALRGEGERRPAEVLARLNRVLCGQINGFATCCAVLLDADGRGVIANAGHLSPYRGGKEMEVEGGLPLGVVAGVAYAERAFVLGLGEEMVFVSDGVVEATGPQGVMFGFGRMEEISRERAGYIAETARAFGQNDDITVIAVRWVGQSGEAVGGTARVLVAG